ncbi:MULTISPECIES: hypothetical protein [unclassified Roseofilum]|nr:MULTISPECIES: hypothetical protein [unclassified Roseofilum]
MSSPSQRKSLYGGTGFSPTREDGYSQTRITQGKAIASRKL